MKNIMLAFLLLSVFAVNAGGKIPSWLEGTWTGRGYQPVDGQSWDVELTVEDGRIDISYPDISNGCTGTWEVVKKKKGVYHLHETITEGPCDPSVEVYITRIDENSISVAYYLPATMDKVVAHTVLEKE